MIPTEVSSETMMMDPALVFAANRARGTARFAAEAAGPVTRRSDVFEDGSLRIRFPSSHSGQLSAVLVNTAGGVAGGDRFAVGVAAHNGANVSVTTAAAEKIYRSHGADSVLDLTLDVGQGARLHWLPQETILFDRVKARRQIEIDLAGDASLLLAEMVVFGRTAMSEALSEGRFIDRWRMRRDGKLIFADTLHLDGRIGESLAQKAVASGAVAIATLLIVPGNDAIVAEVREHVSDDCEIGASSWNGFAIVRFCAQNAATLRGAVIKILANVAPAALPRLWLQ